MQNQGTEGQADACNRIADNTTRGQIVVGVRVLCDSCRVAITADAASRMLNVNRPGSPESELACFRLSSKIPPAPPRSNVHRAAAFKRSSGSLVKRERIPVATASIVQRQPQYVKSTLARQRVRLTIIAFALTLASEILSGWKPRNPLDLADPWVVSGTIAIVAGLLIRGWAAGMLVKKKRLASNGPYALVRHPLYLGSVLMMLGFMLLTGLWWNLVIVAITAFISIGGAIRSEEQFLAGKFGERWTAYASSRGRLLPRSIAGTLRSSWSWERWFQNREFNAVTLSAIVWLGFLVWYR